MRILVSLTFLVLIGFTSCMKKDVPMILPDQGDAISETLSCGADYSTQYYYNLDNASVVHSSMVDSWHLAFESSAKGFGVFLNGGAGLASITTSKTSLGAITASDIDGETWHQDEPNGNVHESAIGNWNINSQTKERVYILRLDASGNEMISLKLLSVTDYSYDFIVGNIHTGEAKTIHLTKDPTRVYTYFDLNTLQKVLDVEPIKESWDILFTRYGFTFYDQNPPLPYIVTGVLTNPATQVFKDSTASFYEIGSEIIQHGTFCGDRDVIGYDWKYYDFDLGVYHVRQDYNFIIRTQQDEYFKMRFLSFYDHQGVKGSPTFEFKQIQ